MDLLGQIIGQLFGVVIVGALILGLLSRDAVDWENLVSAYGRDWRPPRMQKRFANMILYSEGRPAKSYAGVIQIGLHDDGVALRPNRILRPFQKPIFIPYKDIQGWDQGWYLDAKSTELSFRKAPQMPLIMPRDQVEWMLTFAGDAARISAARPPHGTRPWLTYITALAFGVMTLAVIVIIVVKALPNEL
jgi:hypothetical protein